MGRPYFIFFVLTVNICCGQETTEITAVHDLLPINGDTLIAAKWYGGLIVTFNAGKSWSTLSSDILFKSMTIDNKGVIWGMDSWEGIHESDYSRLYKSTNKGKSWTETNFNTSKFFPLTITSQPHNPLRIISQDKKEYSLSGSNLLKDWKYHTTNLNWGDEVKEDNWRLLRNEEEGSLLKKTSKWDTIYHFNDLYAFDIHIKKDTVFVIGAIGGNSRAYFAYLVQEKKLKEFQINGMQAYGIREDNKGRIWIFSTEGIYIVKGDILEKVY